MTFGFSCHDRKSIPQGFGANSSTFGVTRVDRSFLGVNLATIQNSTCITAHSSALFTHPGHKIYKRFTQPLVDLIMYREHGQPRVEGSNEKNKLRDARGRPSRGGNHGEPLTRARAVHFRQHSHLRRAFLGPQRGVSCFGDCWKGLGWGLGSGV